MEGHGLGQRGQRADAFRVNAADLVQEVRIPAGDDVVTFHYRPPTSWLASVLSVGAVAFLLVLLAVG